MNDKKTITTTKNGPLILENFQTITESTGSTVVLEDPITALCRCGKSKNKPYCDGSHGHCNFDDHKEEDRVPRKVIHYLGKEITIHDDRGLCSHAGFCTSLCPEVFNNNNEPWIHPDGATMEKIIETIQKCPSGALSYSVNDILYDTFAYEPKVELVEDGPYRIHGGIELVDEDKPNSKEHCALCRCGKSKNKPFCSGQHWYKKFKDDGLVSEEVHMHLHEESHQGLPYDNKLEFIQQLMKTGKSEDAAMRTLETFPDFKSIVIKCAQLDPMPLNEEIDVNLKTIIGKKAKKPLVLDLPFYVSHMSFGAISKEAKIALATGSALVGTAMCSGEGGMLKESREAAKYYIYENGTAAFTYNEESFLLADAVELKIGQGVKPGLGGHLPAKKVTAEIAGIRHLHPGQESIAPARLHGVDSVEDLVKRVKTIRKIIDGKPVGIKIATAHLEADLEVALAANPDFITIDCRGGATGSTLKVIKDHSGIPPVFAIPRARKYLDDHGGKDVTLIATGGFRDSSDIIKGLALGADAIALATASLIAIGCKQSRICHKGTCPTGIATQDENLRKLLIHDKSVDSFVNFYKGTANELKMFARANGYVDVHEFRVTDLMTISNEISQHTPIEHV